MVSYNETNANSYNEVPSNYFLNEEAIYVLLCKNL